MRFSLVGLLLVSGCTQPGGGPPLGASRTPACEALDVPDRVRSTGDRLVALSPEQADELKAYLAFVYGTGPEPSERDAEVAAVSDALLSLPAGEAEQLEAYLRECHGAERP